MPPPFFLDLADLLPELAFAPLDFVELAEVLLLAAFRRAQRALAAAASLARVAADIGRRRPSVFVLPVDGEEAAELAVPDDLLAPPLLPLPLKSELSRSSRD